MNFTLHHLLMALAVAQVTGEQVNSKFGCCAYRASQYNLSN